MPLRSNLFRNDARLQSCLISDPAHVVPGSVGEFVGKIQVALTLLEGVHLAPGEVATRSYGPSTAAAVLAYKRKRSIVNRSYQTQADNIVGKMTIESLDNEMAQREQRTMIKVEAITCNFGGDGPHVA